MSSAGGYFGLELGNGYEYHKHAIRLNTGRNALEYILISKKYRKIYLPYYTCDVLMEPVVKLGLTVAYYNIDEKLEPEFDYDVIGPDDVFLYTNYFGLKDVFIDTLCTKKVNIIIDNAQSFFSKPVTGIDTFYSARKFFGVPDGAYLYTSQPVDIDFETDVSYRRFEHLLFSVDNSVESGYGKFTENEKLLSNNPIKLMSNLTYRILDSIDYKNVAEKRRANYLYLLNNLQTENALNFPLPDTCIPLVYPFLTANENLREKLFSNRIYTAQFWKNVFDVVSDASIEYYYAKNIIYLPVDQRLTMHNLDFIIKIIKNEY